MYGLHLTPITKMTISMALPQLKQQDVHLQLGGAGKAERTGHHHQVPALRISKGTVARMRFKGGVDSKSLVPSLLACSHGKGVLKVLATKFKINVPTSHAWGSFSHDAAGRGAYTTSQEGLP